MNNKSFPAKLSVSFAAYVIIYSAAVFLLISACASVMVYIFSPTNDMLRSADFLMNIALRATVISVIAAMLTDIGFGRKK